jgi:hypothetical protein
MGDRQAISAQIERAGQVERVLLWLGWLVAALGVVGMAVFAAFWAAGDLDAEQGVSLVLGTTLATVLSGASAYGAASTSGWARPASSSRPGPLTRGRKSVTVS